jgi:hypothetical protein
MSHQQFYETVQRQQEYEMQINPEHIINSIEKTAGIHYRDADAADRLAWQVGALTAKIRELSALLQYTVDQLEELKKEAK